MSLALNASLSDIDLFSYYAKADSGDYIYYL